MLPWLMEQGEVPLADVARRFELTEQQVQHDLELVAMCGLPPFVDEMVDVFIDDGTVFVGIPRLFTRPLRLTAPEAFSLLTSARAAMELPGADRDGPLGRGLAKLSSVLAGAGLDAADASSGDDHTAGVVVDLDRPELTDDIVDAAAVGAELRIVYYSPSRNETTQRSIVPRHVFADAGNWYVLADDDRSDARRTFRIDRIESAEPTGRRVAAPPTAEAPAAFFVDAEVPRVTVRLAPGATWVLDHYPFDSRQSLDDGWTEARLPVSSDRWLAKLLIRLGPDVVLVDGVEENPARPLARAILARYGQ
jgi:proteasome accessory factor C